jgi:hypothetical protein
VRRYMRPPHRTQMFQNITSVIRQQHVVRGDSGLAVRHQRTHCVPPTPQVAPVSATAGLCYLAQLMRQTSGEYLRSDVKRRAGAMFDALSQHGVSFNTVVDVSAVDSAPGIPTGWGTTNTAKWLLWEDPLLHHLSAQVRVNEAEGNCRAIALRC